MPQFSVMCRAVWSSEVIDRLQEKGVYATLGGPVHPQAQEVRRHRLLVEAEDEDDARSKAQALVTEAGGDASDIEVVDRHD